MTEFTKDYPKGDFVSPVNREIKLAGTFGELRPNHFHTGLDIKSLHQTSGDTVYAAAAGYISRIKIDEYGYGNAIYINHPNGFTSVYGHLDRFTDVIQNYVKEQQYLQKSFAVDLYPGKTKFPVAQMQLIAFMGNTGNSDGAHLHFEIRHTNSQTPVNPLDFGLEVTDNNPPVIQQLIIYELDHQDQVVNSHILQPSLIDGNYQIEKPIELGAEKVAFGLRTYDTQDGETNKNGIYSIECKADNKTEFSFSLDEIPFDDGRYINAHIDYKEKVNDDLFFHRCFLLEGNKLQMYVKGQDQGKFNLSPEFPRHCSISVADFKGNTSTLSFQVIRDQNAAEYSSTPTSYQALGTPNEVTIITQQGIQVVWPEGCFYEKTPLNIKTISNNANKSFSPYFEISPSDEPMQKYFDIHIDGLAVPTVLQKRAYIARIQNNRSPINCGGVWIGNKLTTGARQMGIYTILIDTIPPKITPLHFGKVMTGWQQMDFRISDNVRIRDKARDLRYMGFVDGQWILMALDGKTGTLSHQFDGRITPGDHQLVIKVMDDRGNESVFKKSFTL